jgi:hypothetical protein
MGEHRKLAALGVGSALLLAGCSLVTSDSLADQNAAKTADQLATRMTANDLHTAEQLGRTAAEAPNVSLLSLTGTDARTTGITLVIKVHGIGAVPMGEQEPTTADDCFHLSFVNSVHDGTPSQVSCPDLPPIFYPPLPPPLEVPNGSDVLLRKALPTIPAGGAATDAMAVRMWSSIDSWHLDPGIQRDVTVLRGVPDSTGDVLGVALRTDDSCLFGRAAAGTTAAWYVSPRYYRPGELVCDAREAAFGEGR